MALTPQQIREVDQRIHAIAVTPFDQKMALILAAVQKLERSFEKYFAKVLGNGHDE